MQFEEETVDELHTAMALSGAGVAAQRTYERAAGPRPCCSPCRFGPASGGRRDLAFNGAYVHPPGEFRVVARSVPSRSLEDLPGGGWRRREAADDVGRRCASPRLGVQGPRPGVGGRRPRPRNAAADPDGAELLLRPQPEGGVPLAGWSL